MPADAGYKIVNWKGQQLAFHGGISDAEIQAYVANLESPETSDPLSAASKAEGISEQPAFGSNINLSSLIGPTGGDTELPFSVEDLTNLIPGLGGAVGALAGPAGAAGGAGGGEVVRQFLRKLAGYAPGTGMVQDALGLDPNSLAGMATSVGAEALAGGVGEKVASLVNPAKLHEAGLRTYARSLTRGNQEKALAKTTDRIRPIADELPMGTRGRIERIAEEKAKKSGQAVGAIYDQPGVPAAYDRPISELRSLRDESVRNEAFELPEIDPATGAVMTDPATGRDIMKQYPIDISDPALYDAFQGRIDDMTQATDLRQMSGGEISLADLFEQRSKESELARRAKQDAFKVGGADRVPSPKEAAHKAARQSISEEMHRATGSVPEKGIKGEGEIADAIHTGWKTVESGAKLNDPGTFISRWVTARFIPGVGGTAAGAVASNPALWRSIGGKGMMKLSKLIQTGKDAEAEHLLRGAISAFTQEKQHD